MSTNPFAAKRTRSKRLRIAISAVCLVALAGLLASYLISAGKSTVVINDPSPDLSITLNNKPVRVAASSNKYVIPAFPGSYRLQITKPNYQPYVEDVLVTRGEATEVRPAFSFQPVGEQSGGNSIDFVQPAVNEDQIFYLGDGGTRLYAMDVKSQERTALTTTPLRSVTDVQWSSQPNVALIQQNGGTYLREIPIYDYANQTLVKLASGEIKSPVWDPEDPERLAFVLSLPSGERSLAISDKRLSNIDRKGSLEQFENPKLIWTPKNTGIYILEQSVNSSKNDLWKYEFTNGELIRLTEGGNVAGISVSPDSRVVLYEVGRTLRKLENDQPVTDWQVPGFSQTVAWKDASSFYLPASSGNSITEHQVKSGKQTIAFNFPSPLSIRGMHYFSRSNILIFYTSSSLFSVNIAP